jgi:Fe-S cluster assembly scaffold protein SufB
VLKSAQITATPTIRLKLMLADHARCELHWVDLEQDILPQHITLEAFLGVNSLLQSIQIHAPTKNRTIFEQYTLDDESSVEILALIFQKEENIHFNYTPHVHHEGENTKSSIKVRSLLAGHTDTTLCGRISLANGASAIAHYHNHNLMIAGNPRLTAQPELEIDFDRVQCTHGVTLGQIDHNALFYMQSRGLSLEISKTLLLQAFMRKDGNPLLDMYASTLDNLLSKFF